MQIITQIRSSYNIITITIIIIIIIASGNSLHLISYPNEDELNSGHYGTGNDLDRSGVRID